MTTSDEEAQGGLGDAKLSVTVNGNRYDMEMGDFSAADEVAFRQETGGDLMTPFMTGQVNSIVIAGLVWRTRVRFGEKKLNFDTVAKQVKFRDLDTIELKGFGTDDEDEPAPKPTQGPPSPEG